MVLDVNNMVAHYHLDTSAPGSKTSHWCLGMRMYKQESWKIATCLYTEGLKELYLDNLTLRSKCGNDYLTCICD